MNHTEKTVDIVVLGAGPGGLGAAIQAARNGAHVLLVDKNGYLGGNMTIGLPLLGFLDRDANQVIRGLAEEFMNDLRAYKTAYGTAGSAYRYCPLHNSVALYDHEIFKFIALRKVLDAGIEVLLHTELESVNVDNRRIRSIRLRGKGYEIDVYAKVFIDATGDGDMAYLAGASYDKGQKGTGVIQPPTLMFTLGGVEMERLFDYIAEHPDEMDKSPTVECAPGYNAEYFRSDPTWVMVALRNLYKKLRKEGKVPVDREDIIIINSLLPGEVHMNCTRHLGTDGSDVFSLTKAEIEGYLQIEQFVHMLQNEIPGFEKCYITNINPSMGIRESRRFSGIRTLTEDDLLNGVIPEDSIALGSYSVDIHMGDGSSTDYRKVPPYGIPYGITVSNEIEGLMFAGRCASMDAVAMSSARVMPICMAMGEGAGIGAALAVKQGISPSQVDVNQIRERVLKSNGML